MVDHEGSPGPYLCGLALDGRRVVVVGGGGVAQRRLPALLAAGAEVLLVAPQLTPTLLGLHESGALRWRAGDFTGGDLDGAWYVLAATDVPDVNASVVAEATRRRIFCVRADDAPSGTAVTPATGSSGGVGVGVLAGGDPRRAAAVRDALVAHLDSGAVDLTPRRAGVVDADAWSFAGGRGGVALVGAGPGDPDLVTVRGRELLRRADVVVADRLASQRLLEVAPAGAEVVDAAKLPGGREMPQEEINSVIVRRAGAGLRVVRLKGGDPFVFGRGQEEVDACAAEGLPVLVVPGVSSALAVPALAGIPVTHRGLSQEVHVVSGHLPPGHPRSQVAWEAIGRAGGTLVLLMAVRNLPAIVAALLGCGRDPATPAAAVQDGTLPGQRVVTATLEGLPEAVAGAGIRPPAIVVVGEVVAMRERRTFAAPAGADTDT